MTPAARAARARALALEAGFDLAGVASAEAPRELGFFQDWIARGYAGEMAYLTSQRDRRSDLRTAFPWARSVLCVGLQYDTAGPYSTAAAPERVECTSLCSEEMRCKLPNSTFDAVSEPVRATPTQPSKVPKNGYRNPVCANARPSVASTPE